jgi:hypothetical protein
MKIRAYSPTDRAHEAWVRDVTAALEDAESTVAFRWNSDAAPVRVITKLATRPFEVRVARATADGGATQISGAAITWAYDGGTLIVAAIGTLTASTDYDVTLTVVR